MDHKKVATGVLTILLAIGVLGLFAFTAKASGAAGRVAPEALALTAPGWEQANSNGFGDPGAGEVTALEAFNGYLYAGTHNPIDPEPLYDGAGIFRSPDGVTWTAVIDPGFGVAHDAAPPAILDLAVFKGYLYAGTGRGNAAKIYRSINGLNWAPVVNSGFGDPDNVNVDVLAEYNSYLYAGVTNAVTGPQIWRSLSGSSNSWTQVGPESPGSAPAKVTALTVFSNTLYAAIEPESDAPLQIWRSYGGDVWETVTSDGFGDSNNTMTGGMVVFDGYLYLGGGNVASGAQLWRSSDGANWTAVTPAFGDSNNQKVDLVTVFQNQLYISTRNAVTGIEIWRWTYSTTWEQANQDGFGDSNDVNSNWNNAAASFLGQLYVGTANVADGGELWRMIPPYSVDLSPADAKAAAAGQSVTYTVQITNTGGMSDTYDLTLSGGNWTTTLSTLQVSLTPAAATAFTVTVIIPPDTLGNAADAVTVTATSQGDAAKSDSALLTTSVTPTSGILLSGNDSLSGQPGAIVTYTLWITNTGNVIDTFDVELSGNVWTSVLSVPSITLAAGQRGSFTVVVEIPLTPATPDTDSVIVLAVSRNDSAQSDTAELITAQLALKWRVFIPLVMRG